jgi:pSer/pThr/pTyr-binding forkhead associated (FHA) protein
MSPTDWYCPDADENGFVPFEVLEKRAGRGSRQQFLKDFPVPGLLVVYRAQDPSGGPDFRAEADTILDPTDRGVQLLTMSIRSTAILRYLGKVAFVTKRPGNPFAHLISIGRSVNNDITLAVDSVSKVHGYFVSAGGGWSFNDHGSTNGSRLDGVAIVAGERYPLADGNVLQLGLEALLEFLSPESLYRRALQKDRRGS